MQWTPAANFSADPTSGPPPLQVQFTDESAGNPTGWAWYFGDEAFNEPWTEMTICAEWKERYYHTSVALPEGSIVLMGGSYICNNNLYTRNNIWRSTDQGATWTQMTTSVPDYDHSSVALPDGSIVLTLAKQLNVWRHETVGSNEQRLHHGAQARFARNVP